MGSDMQMSDEGSEAEMDVDGENEQTNPSKRVEQDDQDQGEEEEEEGALESEELSPPPSPPAAAAPQPRFTIRLIVPQARKPETTQSEEPSQPPSRRAASRDIDIESEDDDEDNDEGEGATAGGSRTRPMTSRQAVLASVVDSSHVSLSIAPAESSRKKKQLTENEIALRREETARKRKNLSEKKLEDEKAETINRLLKKQSKAKSRRTAAAISEDRTPATPATPAEDDGGEDGCAGGEVAVTEVVPVMYRWISTTRPSGNGDMKGGSDGKNGDAGADGTGKENVDNPRMRLTFSIPVCALPSAAAHITSDSAALTNIPITPEATKKQPPVCDVEGCTRARKYRLVKDWMRGACGMEHLRVLEGRSGVDAGGGKENLREAGMEVDV
ncbi:hypothetical protein BJ138DRAFT_1161317 [Hygrophoropsis aurantiaca]|uniref:Uncharacterized protein n=1 Tax=Hygrophoropsis aurantiaca TaxID=72124 RepID=A0ACB8A166_9AGAM|nr:hypothetical protein BJ138DRAFT_1161317 [Hygrophoropsis aurantiaca]